MRLLSKSIITASALGLGLGFASAAIAQTGKAARLSVQQDRITAQGNAQGTPQRNPAIPRGLASAFERGVPGILNAIQRTVGSNSRLQDLPASP